VDEEDAAHIFGIDVWFLLS